MLWAQTKLSGSISLNTSFSWKILEIEGPFFQKVASKKEKLLAVWMAWLETGSLVCSPMLCVIMPVTDVKTGIQIVQSLSIALFQHIYHIEK